MTLAFTIIEFSNFQFFHIIELKIGLVAIAIIELSINL